MRAESHTARAAEAALASAADVIAAAERIAPHIHRTPVLTSRRLDAQLGATVFFKCENLQRTGSFKPRGALNALAQLAGDQRRAGVVAYSSGNHAQAVAYAGQVLGVATTILMPTDAPASKLAATRGYGAEVILYDRLAEDREALGNRLAAERGLALIPPYDHPHIVAGQGTAAYELLQAVPDLDAVVTPLGGGGLLSGTALITAALRPGAAIYGGEPALGDDGRQSFDTGRIVHIPPPDTIADGARTQHLGQITFPVIRSLATDVLTVTDPQLVEAMKALAATMKIVVEPTGALGAAAVAVHAARFAGKRVGVIVSGGNVDLARYAELIG